MIKLGDRITVKPATFDVPGQGRQAESNPRDGRLRSSRRAILRPRV